MHVRRRGAQHDSPDLLSLPPRTQWLSTVADVASLIGLAVAVGAQIRFDVSGLLLLYVCALSAWSLWRNFRNARDVRYADAVPLLHRSLASVEVATEQGLFANNRMAANQSLLKSLDHLAETFTFVTGAPCRVCIAETYTESDTTGERSEWFAKVVWRSNTDLADGMGRPHPVKANTDFIRTMETRRPFFANDLPSLYWGRRYENSNWTQEKVRSGEIDYRAAIVLPVAVQPTSKGDPAARVIAFVCIDSLKRNVFSKHVDVALGAAYARAAYPLLRFLLDARDPSGENV